MKSPTSSPCVYTPPDALGTSTGDSISILPNTICADTPRPSETGNMSTSVDSAGNATQQNDPIVDQLLSLSNLTATLISQSQKLSPWQAAAVEKSVSAMLSAVGGESKDKPVDLATSPPSSDQDKSSWIDHNHEFWWQENNASPSSRILEEGRDKRKNTLEYRKPKLQKRGNFCVLRRHITYPFTSILVRTFSVSFQVQ